MPIRFIHKIVKLMTKYCSWEVRWGGGDEGRGKEPVCGVPVSKAWISELQHPHPHKMLHVAVYDCNPMLQEAETDSWHSLSSKHGRINTHQVGWATPFQQINWTAVEEDRWLISGLHIHLNTCTCTSHGITVSEESVIGKGDIRDTFQYMMNMKMTIIAALGVWKHSCREMPWVWTQHYANQASCGHF